MALATARLLAPRRLVQAAPRTLDFSFGRNSLAYTADGKVVPLNVPRFEPGKFGQAVLVEEGTTNKIETEGGGASQDWTKWSHWGYRDYWQSETQYDDPVMGKVFEGVCNNPPYLALFDYYPYSITSGVVYTATIWLKASVAVSGLLTRAYFYDGTNTLGYTTKTIDLTTEWQKFEWQITATATTTAAGFGIGASIIPAGTTVYAARPQLEQKPYATSFINGTSSPESLTIPTEGVLNENEFDITGWFIPAASSSVVPRWAHIWGLKGVPLTGLYIDGSVIRFAWNNKEVINTNISLSANDQLFYSVSKSGSNVVIRLAKNDGALSTFTGTTDGTTLGATEISLGSNGMGRSFYNGKHDDLRISSRARTDEEIAAAYSSNAPLPVDEWTTYKLDFDF